MAGPKNWFVSLVVGGLVFVVAGIGVTEALGPYVWPAAMIGLPVGIVAAAVAVPLTYLGLSYRAERRATGRASAKTRRRLRTLAGATVGFVCGGGLAMAILWTQAVGLAAALAFGGLPVGLLSALVTGYLAFRWDSADKTAPE